MHGVNKSCSNCVSRFICPNNYRPCDGYNDENLFWGLIKLHFPFQDESIDKKREFIKELQRCNQESKEAWNKRVDNDAQ